MWAVEDTSVQLSWGDLPAGEIEARSGDAVARVTQASRGPGVISLNGLSPGTIHEIVVTHEGGHKQLSATTLEPLPGEELFRLATISDLHIGAHRWGLLNTMAEDPSTTRSHGRLYPYRCARSAIEDAVAWGAERLVVKGDAVHHRIPSHYQELGELLDEFPDLPTTLLPGNHDVDHYTRIPLPPAIGRRGLCYSLGVDYRDLPGFRLIVGDTTIPGRGHGSLESIADELVEVADTDRPALMTLHHSFHPYKVMTAYPPSIPSREAGPFLKRLAAVNPNVLITSGHSHRNRSRVEAGLTLTEVASTRDWPGVWAGYVVAEGGIRQVVRRSSAPDAVMWHEYSRGALWGLWEFWSPGLRRQRCFNLAFKNLKSVQEL